MVILVLRNKMKITKSKLENIIKEEVELYFAGQTGLFDQLTKALGPERFLTEIVNSVDKKVLDETLQRIAKNFNLSK